MGGRNTFFLQNNAEVTFRPEDILMIILTILMHIGWNLQSLFTTAAFGICSVTLWIATTNFLRILQRSSSEDNRTRHFNQLQQKFHELLRLSKVISSTWGMVFFWVIFEAGSTMVTHLDDVRSMSMGFRGRTFVMYFFLFTAVALILSAECARKVRF